MTKLADLKRDFLHDPENKAAYDALASEFDLAHKLITARAAFRPVPSRSRATYGNQAKRNIDGSKAPVRISVSKS